MTGEGGAARRRGPGEGDGRRPTVRSEEGGGEGGEEGDSDKREGLPLGREERRLAAAPL
jgi:hypothetical protein